MHKELIRTWLWLYTLYIVYIEKDISRESREGCAQQDTQSNTVEPGRRVIRGLTRWFGRGVGERIGIAEGGPQAAPTKAKAEKKAFLRYRGLTRRRVYVCICTYTHSAAPAHARARAHTETKTHSPNTGARANNTPQVARPPHRGAC